MSCGNIYLGLVTPIVPSSTLVSNGGQTFELQNLSKDHSDTDSSYQLTPPSSPPTLSSSPPAERLKPRFACLASPLPTEEPHDYSPGGYHPVHLGELLHHRQYQIIRNGGFSTVWLARDLSYVRVFLPFIH